MSSADTTNCCREQRNVYIQGCIQFLLLSGTKLRTNRFMLVHFFVMNEPECLTKSLHWPASPSLSQMCVYGEPSHTFCILGCACTLTEGCGITIAMSYCHSLNSFPCCAMLVPHRTMVVAECSAVMLSYQVGICTHLHLMFLCDTGAK